MTKWERKLRRAAILGAVLLGCGLIPASIADPDQHACVRRCEFGRYPDGGYQPLWMPGDLEPHVFPDGAERRAWCRCTDACGVPRAMAGCEWMPPLPGPEPACGAAWPAWCVARFRYDGCLIFAEGVCEERCESWKARGCRYASSMMW